MSHPAPVRNALAWFEIPVLDLDRAQRFYETLLERPIRREQIVTSQLGVFAYDEGGAGGCLIAGPQVAPPSTSGSLVYLDAGASLDAALAWLAAAGGRLAAPKTTLPGDMGAIAHIIDTEGNRVGLHAAQ